MPKKVSESQKKEMVDSFIKGKTINQLTEVYNCTKITIKRHLKNNIDESTYKSLIEKNNQKNLIVDNVEKNEISEPLSRDYYNDEDKIKFENINYEHSFVEISPLDYEINNEPQKDLSSVPLSEIEFPNVVYMIVDKKIELEIKLLKHYPEWEFLSQNELNRKTIEIFFDLKIAKRSCNKEQKVIKVPNTDVFKITTPLLLKKGISRIVSADKLIAL